MSAAVINLYEEKLFRSYDKIGNAIIDYINNMDLSWKIELARQIYFENYTMSSNLLLKYKPFIQWLIFSYKIHNDNTLIDCIYENYINNMCSYEKSALISLKNTYESLYKVYSIKNDIVLVKDVFLNTSIELSDKTLAHKVKRYSGIFMRIVTINGKNMAIPGYCVMSNNILKKTQLYVKNSFNEFTKVKKDITIHNFINLNNLLLHKQFLNYRI